jgi:hypothetical protein
LQFANEEAEEAKSGAAVLHEVTPSSFSVAGLELEGQQYVVLIGDEDDGLTFAQATRTRPS